MIRKSPYEMNLNREETVGSLQKHIDAMDRFLDDEEYDALVSLLESCQTGAPDDYILGLADGLGVSAHLVMR